MNYFVLVAFILLPVFRIGVASYASSLPTYRYNLTLSTGNHSFPFVGITKISFTLNGYNFSYTNLNHYHFPTKFTKQVELDFSLEPLRNITIEWSYRWRDFTKNLIYRPKLLIKKYTISQIYINYGSRRQSFRNEMRRKNSKISKRTKELKKVFETVDLNQYGDDTVEENYDFNLNDLNNGPTGLKYNQEEIETSLSNVNLKLDSVNPDQNLVDFEFDSNENDQTTRFYRQRIIDFCPSKDKKNGVETMSPTILTRCSNLF